jgi:hypothetical protein
MAGTYTVTGVQTDGHTLQLDEELPLFHEKLRIVIEPVATAPINRYAEVMASVREAQKARGHVPRTKAEIDAGINAERDRWDA